MAGAVNTFNFMRDEGCSLTFHLHAHTVAIYFSAVIR